VTRLDEFDLAAGAIEDTDHAIDANTRVSKHAPW
jgi:hypothetical protein